MDFDFRQIYKRTLRLTCRVKLYPRYLALIIELTETILQELLHKLAPFCFFEVTGRILWCCLE